MYLNISLCVGLFYYFNSYISIYIILMYPYYPFEALELYFNLFF